MKTGEWIEIEDQFLTNKPKGRAMPRGHQWEYFLWACRCSIYRAKIKGKVRKWTIRRKYLHLISGPNKRAVDQELENLVRRKDVRLV